MALASRSIYINDEDTLHILDWADELVKKNRASFSAFMVNLLVEEYQRQTEGEPESPSQGRILARLDQLERTMEAMFNNITVVHEHHGGEVASAVNAVPGKVIESTALDGLVGENW
jgi:hypothetical protein